MSEANPNQQERSLSVQRILEGLPVEIDKLEEFERATFATTQRPSGVVKVRHLPELQEVLRRLSTARIPVYPISGGFNWGLGSRVPSSDGAVILDLRSMRSIRSYDDVHGCITVEAGVSFAQVSNFLEARNSRFYLPVIGGPPSASVIGNLAERGDGVGPHGDRSRHVSNLEVALATGEVVNTGFASFGAPGLAQLAREVPGPHIHDLFIQSNLGVITAATLWLPRRPKFFQGVVFSLSPDRELPPLFEALRDLCHERLIEENGFAFWNVFKFLAAQGHFPRGKVRTYEDLRAYLPRGLRNVEWLGYLPAYSPSALHALAVRRAVTSRLRKHVDRLSVLDPLSTGILGAAPKFWSTVFGLPIEPLVQAFYSRSIALGFPNEMNTRSVYWRKSEAPKGSLDPDRDRCGLHWLCHLLPFDGGAADDAAAIVNEACLRFGFEPNLAFLNPTPRVLRLFVVLVFDRDKPGEEERALDCLEQMRTALAAKGIVGYRFGLQTMDQFAPQETAYSGILSKMKSALDPSGIISPGHYEPAPVSAHYSTEFLRLGIV